MIAHRPRPLQIAWTENEVLVLTSLADHDDDLEMSARHGELWENESREARKRCKIIRFNRFSTVGGSREELKLGF